MQDDKTEIKPLVDSAPEPDGFDRTILLHFRIKVKLIDPGRSAPKEYWFINGFAVGRAAGNDILINSGEISRHHLKVTREHGNWWIQDLNSANGTSVNAERIKGKSRLILPSSISLGNAGVGLEIHPVDHGAGPGRLEPDNPAAGEPEADLSGNKTGAGRSKDEIRRRLLSEEDSKDFGDYTRMVRLLIREEGSHRKKRYNTIIYSLLGAVLASLALIIYQQVVLFKTRSMAINLFYDMKLLEVNLSKAEQALDGSLEALRDAMQAVVRQKLKTEEERIKAELETISAEQRRVAEEKKKLFRMREQYQGYVREVKSLQFGLPSVRGREDELIAKVARDFGESELEVPDGFRSSVKRYIKIRQSSSRLPVTLNRIEKNGYGSLVVSALAKAGLPIQFMYLPLQESNYDEYAIGPETRYGIAKGA